MLRKINHINCFVIVTITLYVLLCISPLHSSCQADPAEPAEPPPIIEQQFENLTESNDDAVSEDDSYLQELFHFIKNPININYANEGQLQELKILTPIQINSLMLYRKLLGNFINIYELQAVPGWDVGLIKKILPYITVSLKVDVLSSLADRLKEGHRSLLMRGLQILERSRGYRIDSSLARNYYLGSAQKVLLRYKYTFKNLLQYGVTGEKDAGEQFFRGAQKSGFDFYSAHFFVKNTGIIKSMVLGDYTVNLGQGLTQWQGLAFKKGPDVINIKRQSDILRPYNSAGEIVFNRGIGVTLKKNDWEGTGFVSYRRADANFNIDTLNPGGYVSSLQTSGYHRTASEVADKNSEGILTLGGNCNYTNDRLHVGVNAVHYHFQHPVIRPAYLYNTYALSGKTAGNYGVDYSYTYRNLHFFGEAAADQDFYTAFVDGLLISVNPHVDMSFLYRNISRGYTSLYTNAFTENSYPANESGFYTGVSISPQENIKINAYADFYHFPWLKYSVDAPSSGNDYLIEFTYNPNKQVQFYARYKTEKKPVNDNPGGLALNPLAIKTKQGLRTQFLYKLTSNITIRSRVELSWFDKKGPDAENGYLIYTDVLYKKMFRPISGNVRLQYFETDGYNSRLYAYENTVLYGYSIPVFYEKGYRYYININYSFNKNLSFWGRFAQTVYPGKKIIGSGLDEITGHSKSEATLQAIWQF